jgi:hypothetical protein
MNMSPKLKIAQDGPIDGSPIDGEDKESPVRSPEREALAQEIARRDSILSETKALSAGVAYARDEIRRARQMVTTCEDNLEQAKADTAKHMVSRALGASAPGHRTSAQTRLALQAAQDELDSAIEAEATLAGRLREWEQRLAITGVHNRVQAVIQTDPATVKFLRDFGELETRYLKAKAFVSECPTFHPPNKFELIGDTKVFASEHVAPWKNWEKRLNLDPDAELILPD